jgi:hypothetical protein
VTGRGALEQQRRDELEHLDTPTAVATLAAAFAHRAGVAQIGAAPSQDKE